MTLILLCAECQDKVTCYEDWIKHLLSTKHRQLVRHRLSNGDWSVAEDERTLIVFGVKQKKNGYEIRAIDLLWHYSSQGALVTDFYWDKGSMDYAVIQFDSKEQAELIAGDHQANILPGRRQLLTVQLKSHYEISLLEVAEKNNVTNKQPSQALNDITSNLERTNATTVSSENAGNFITPTAGKAEIDGISDSTKVKPRTSRMIEVLQYLQTTQVRTETTTSAASCDTDRNGAINTLQTTPTPSTSKPDASVPVVDSQCESKHAEEVHFQVPVPLLTSEPEIVQITTRTAKGRSRRRRGKKSRDYIICMVCEPAKTNAEFNEDTRVENCTPSTSMASLVAERCSSPSNTVSSTSNTQQKIQEVPSNLSAEFYQTNKSLHQEFIQMKLNLDEQLARFYNITLSSEEVALRETVIYELKIILQTQYKQCKVEPFGSFIFGCCSSKSEVDVYVNLNGEPPNVEESITRDGWAKTIMLLKLKGYVDTYSLITPIENTNHLAINITRSKTNIRLALQFGLNAFLSLRRSLLIEFLTQLESFVAPMLFLVRYWAKYYGLCSATKLNKYALDLMTITFLKRNGIIPSVNDLKDMNNAGEIMVNGWNTGFTQDLEAARNFLEWDFFTSETIPPLEICKTTGFPTGKTLLLMFKEFLKTCSEFDYAKDMICSLTSEYLPRSVFASQEAANTSSPALKLYWITGISNPLDISSPLCIQDPFDLSCNVVASAKVNTLDEFVLRCKSTVESINTLLANPSPVFLDLFGGLIGSGDENPVDIAGTHLAAALVQAVTNLPNDEPRSVSPSNSTSPEVPSQSCSPAPSQTLTSIAPLTFTPNNCHFNKSELLYTFCGMPAIFRKRIDNGRISSLWLVLMEKFFLDVFLIAYKMRIITKEDTCSTSTPNSLSSGPPFTTGAQYPPDFESIVKAFSNYPLLENESSGLDNRKITLCVEGEKILPEDYTRLDKLCDGRSMQEGISPLEFEGQLYEEIIRQYKRAGTFQFNVTATIKLEEVESDDTKFGYIIAPRFIIEFYEYFPIAESLASRFKILVPKYLRFEFERWLSQISR